MTTNHNSDLRLEVSRLVEQLEEVRNQAGRATKLLRSLSGFDPNRAENLRKIKETLRKIRQFVEKLNGLAECVKHLRDWVEDYREELERTQQKLQQVFGTELEKALRERGLSLQGYYPKFKSGLFTIELDFDGGRSVLWYGPNQERLGYCTLSSEEIAKKIEEFRGQLGSRFSEEEFLKVLYRAYERVLVTTGGRDGDPVPIIKVLPEVAHLLQEALSHTDPQQEHCKEYGRADFSYDLFQLRRLDQSTLFERRLHLVVATRAYTKRRQDFLWIPDDETGKGTPYSHLKFEEGAT